MDNAKKKKFTFINLAIGLRSINISVNFGIATLVPILKRYSYDVSVLHMPEELDSNDFCDKIERTAPSIVGFSCTTSQYPYLKKYSQILLEKKPEVLQLAGGVHPTLDPICILSETAIQGACVGEGEIPMDNLLQCIEKKLDITDVKGFYWKSKDGIKKNAIPDFVNDLSTLSPPDYSVFDRNLVVTDSYAGRLLLTKKSDIKNMLLTILSRGCPYKCYYCCNDALAHIYATPEKYFRIPSVDYSISFLQALISQYPEAQYILFLDDLLISNKEWFLAFSQKYAEEIRLPYDLNIRFEHLTIEIAEALKYSGCRRVRAGVESGDRNVRENILNRFHSNSLIVEKSKLLKSMRIALMTYNIIGLPFETEEQMNATLQLNKKISPEFGTCFYFYPYKNTVLYDLCKRNDLLKSEKVIYRFTNNYNGPAIKLVNISEKDCLKFHKKITVYFFIQALKYRSKEFMVCHRGYKKLYFIIYFTRLLVSSFSIYYNDYIKKRNRP